MSIGLTRDDRFLREFVLESSHGVFAVDASGAVVFSNGVLESRLGVDSDDLRDEQLATLCEGGGALDRVREAAAGSPGAAVEFTLRDTDGERVRIAATCETTALDGSRYFTLWFRERFLEGAQRAAVPREGERPAGLSVADLSEIGRDLLRQDDPEAVAEAGLVAAERVLGTDVGCVWLLDDESGEFDRVATTERAAELLASRPTFDLNRSLAGRAVRREEPVVDRPEGTDAGGAVGRANLHVPLDGRGALTVFSTGADLATRDVELASDLASLVAASLARAETESGESVDGTSDAYDLPMHDIVTEAVDGGDRGAIGRRICRRLVETDAYGGAWFVAADVDGELRAIEASAGDTDTQPPGISRIETGDDDGDDPMSRAIGTDEICLVRNRQTVRNGNGDSRSDRTETVVVPASHGDRTYGVLVLQSGSERSFDSSARSELAVLGDVVGLAVYAAESKKLLLSEKVQQLEFEVTDPDCLAVAVSDATDAFCEIEHQTLTNDGDHLCYLQIEGASPEAARRAAAAAPSVTDCRIVETGDDGCLLEVTKTRSGAEAMMDVGATVRRATAEEGVGTLIVETPLSADVREVVDAYTALNPESRLVAKREIDRPVPTTDTLGESLDDVLTDKQESVLTAAYYAGYFEWPRANTAEEVADSLGISPATFHQHLRVAERKLLDLVCEEQAHLHER